MIKIIEEKTNVKYLGVVRDQFLTFQDEIKKILRKMACGIKTLQSIKKPLPLKTRFLIMNALVISHLHYPTISANLTISLEKQNILPVTMFQDYKILCHFWKIQHQLLPAYNNIKYDNHQIDINTRNKKFYFGDRYNQAKGFELTIGIKNRNTESVQSMLE